MFAVYFDDRLNAFFWWQLWTAGTTVPQLNIHDVVQYRPAERCKVFPEKTFTWEHILALQPLAFWISLPDVQAAHFHS